MNRMLRNIPLTLALCTLLLTGCGESVQPEKTAPVEPKAYENNAMDTVGVAEGDEQVSPFGKPAR